VRDAKIGVKLRELGYFFERDDIDDFTDYVQCSDFFRLDLQLFDLQQGIPYYFLKTAITFRECQSQRIFENPRAGWEIGR
jgi:hypothetical protein